jgi:hypothetical protein
MILALLAASTIAPISGSWKVVDGLLEGTETCAISQSFADGTSFLFIVDENNVKRNEFSLVAENKKWSIREGERLGDIAVKSGPYAFGSVAATGPGLFIIGSFLDRLILFLRAASDSGFTIRISERNKEIGPYAPAGLKPAVDKLEVCLRNRFSKSPDPFAK